MLCMPQNSELLTADEVAPMVRRSAETVLRWARLGKLTCVRLPSGQVLFRQADVDELLAVEPAR